ncbi:hypothetical protein [Streptomyces sp. VRA16 Mangrove soil]|uniref:hypothetical protein n=1 Tax=Streptomyces sp. VRA16 Mangrove soil TaxID=2817434 RepID=UPI001A9EFBF1|nr:hypothetical protein [Streptomyces sp. VRA16 Mangrove soil]MBO1334130.1 hypothetical protein [Streptomyces sp. VRA16 Mangrove soil]
MSGGWGAHMWSAAKTARFAAHTPEALYAMVEPANGATAADLGRLLTQASTTIKEIGDDLKTHSTAVEWEGEGGDAFRKWIHETSLATLSLGDYSETAGKWLGHAADTLHEVKPQLETLKDSSLAAQKVLDAHAAKATDVGNHDGGPSTTEVESAQKQAGGDQAEAAQLMMKLAQSYNASTEQIEALKAPEFPVLPTRFVPEIVDGDEDVYDSSQDTGTAAVVGGVGVAAVGAAAIGEASRSSSLAYGNSSASAPSTAHAARVVPDFTTGGTGTSLDRVGTLPSPSVPATAPPATPSLQGGTSGLSAPTTGAPPPVFGGATSRTGVPPRGAGAAKTPSAFGPRGPLGTPASPGETGAPGTPRGTAQGRGVPGLSGRQGTPSGAPSSVRGPGGASPGRAANGISGGRPTTPQAGRPATAPSRGTVVGGTPTQSTPGARGAAAEGAPRAGANFARGSGYAQGRGAASDGARLPAHSDGVAGGQPQASKTRRNQPPATRGAGLLHGAAGDAAHTQRVGAPARGSVGTSRKDDARNEPAERSRDERAASEETEAEQNQRPLPPPRLPGLPAD